MKRLHRTLIVFTIITLVVWALSIVYHDFGRGTYSLAMDHAFWFPLFFGVFFTMMLMGIQKRVPFVGTSGYRLFINISGLGIATLTMYNIMYGILEIAGTHSVMLPPMRIAGFALLIFSYVVLTVLLVNAMRALRQSTRRRPAASPARTNQRSGASPRASAPASPQPQRQGLSREVAYDRRPYQELPPRSQRNRKTPR